MRPFLQNCKFSTKNGLISAWRDFKKIFMVYVDLFVVNYSSLLIRLDYWTGYSALCILELCQKFPSAFITAWTLSSPGMPEWSFTRPGHQKIKHIKSRIVQMEIIMFYNIEARPNGGPGCPVLVSLIHAAFTFESSLRYFKWYLSRV